MERLVSSSHPFPSSLQQRKSSMEHADLKRVCPSVVPRTNRIFRWTVVSGDLISTDLLFIRQISMSFVHLNTGRSPMPSAFCELSLLIAFHHRHLGLSPAAVLFGAKGRQPQPFHEMTSLRVIVHHISFKEIRQHLLVGLLWVSMNSLTPHSKDCTGLKAD